MNYVVARCLRMSSRNFLEISMNDLLRMLPEIEDELRLGVLPSASQLMTRTKSLTETRNSLRSMRLSEEEWWDSCCRFRLIIFNPLNPVYNLNFFVKILFLNFTKMKEDEFQFSPF